MQVDISKLRDVLQKASAEISGVVIHDFEAYAVAERVVQFLEGQKSFSKIIIENNEAHKTCEKCGQLCVAYKEKFRRDWLFCLLALQDVLFGEGTYKEIADALHAHYGYGEKIANSVARSFMLSRHWGAIEKTDTRKARCPTYRITEKGKLIFQGVCSFPQYLWIPARHAEIDTMFLPKAPIIRAHELKKADNENEELSDKQKHVEESISLLP